jgi:V8-like Glu-specific endopeptidase
MERDQCRTKRSLASRFDRNHRRFVAFYKRTTSATLSATRHLEMKSLLISILFGAAAWWAPTAVAQTVSYPSLLGAEAIERFPFSMAGQLIFASGDLDYQGSGTVVYKRSVLTAAHNCWDIDNGWSTNVEFNRARAGSATPNQAFARRIYVFAGYQGNARRYGADSVRAFAADLGGLRFPTALAKGSFAGWRADFSLLTGGAYNVALGYGADQHTGDDLLFVEPSFAFEQIYTTFFENESLTFEGGMSGGPIFAEVAPGDLRLTGVIVAGSDDPPTGAVRALNAAAARFLRAYLTY